MLYVTKEVMAQLKVSTGVTLKQDLQFWLAFHEVTILLLAKI